MSRTEKDNVDFAGILCVGCVSVGVTLTVVVGVQSLYARTVKVQFDQKVLAAPTPESDSAMAEQEAKLTRYGWLDKGAGRVSIPIERAMELELMHRRQQREGGPDVASSE